MSTEHRQYPTETQTEVIGRYVGTHDIEIVWPLGKADGELAPGEDELHAGTNHGWRCCEARAASGCKPPLF